MTLQDLIDGLSNLDPATVAPRGFHNPHSWRGVYAELAFEPTDGPVTVAEMLATAKSALGQTYEGWKGGEFTMHAHTDVHIDYEGQYGGADIVNLWLAALAAPTSGASPDVLDELGRRFGAALADKARRSCQKYGWQITDWLADDWQQECQQGLTEHLGKGDPLDVGVYAAFLWHHNWPTLAPGASPVSGGAGEGPNPEQVEFLTTVALAYQPSEYGKLSSQTVGEYLNVKADYELATRPSTLLGLLRYFKDSATGAASSATGGSPAGEHLAELMILAQDMRGVRLDPTASAIHELRALQGRVATFGTAWDKALPRLSAALSPGGVAPADLTGLPEGEYHLADLENRLYWPFGDPGLPLADATLIDHVCQYARRLEKKLAGAAPTPVAAPVAGAGGETAEKGGQNG